MTQRIEIPLVGGQYIGRSTDVDAQECINLYPVVNQSGGKVLSLQPIPGLKTWSDVGIEAEVRLFHKLNSVSMYAVIGNTVYKIATDGTYTALAAVLANNAGPLQSIDNGTQILILDPYDGKGYVIEADVVTEIADADFPVGSSLTYQDGYAVVSAKDSKRFYISTLDTASVVAYSASDFTRWNPLEVGSVGSILGNLKAIFMDHDELWAFGDEQVGFYYNSPNPDFPFSETQHPFQEVGLGGTPSCIAKLDNSLYWLDLWHNVRRAEGYTPIIVSTPEVSYNFEQFAKISDMISFAYRYEGQAFYVLTSPSEGKTYCLDVSTKEWTLRSSGLAGGRWRGNCYVHYADKHLIGDYENGKIYEMDHSLYTENGETVKATRTTRHIDAQRRNVTYNRIELHIESGVGNVVAPGDDPQVMLSWSDDGGHTWSNEHWGSMGKIGEYPLRLIWRKTGMSRDRIFKFEITDPVNRVLIALFADVTIGKN